MSEAEGRNARVYAVVSCIPRGCVATYGQVAALAGIEGPSGGRQVGFALSALGPAHGEVPWHRVINARGTVSRRSLRGREATQYERLALEGVCADAAGHIDIARYGWQPEF